MFGRLFGRKQPDQQKIIAKPPEFEATTAKMAFQTSLDISPDEILACFIEPTEGKQGKLVIYETGTNNLRWSFPVPNAVDCECKFVGSNRLVLLYKKTSDDYLAQLFDANTGTVVAESQIPAVSFGYGTVDVTSGYLVTKSLRDILLLMQTTGDTIVATSFDCERQISDGPKFGPDGKCYVLVGGNLICVEGNKKRSIVEDYNYQRIGFAPSGKVYCAGGYDDRGAETILDVVDLTTGATSRIPVGREPIHQMLFAGSDRLLVASRVSDVYVKQYPHANIILLSIERKQKVWNLEIRDMPPHRYPMLLCAPEDGWVLIRDDVSIRRITLQDKKTIQNIRDRDEELIDLSAQNLHKKRIDWIKAQWLPSKRLLYITRNPDIGIPGTIEYHNISRVG